MNASATTAMLDEMTRARILNFNILNFNSEVPNV